MRTYYVYIMASRSRVLYIGVTNDLARRAYEHKRSLPPSFTSTYRITRLVYFEEFGDVRDAIVAELLDGPVPAELRALLQRGDATTTVGLVLGSPDFQRR